MKGSDHLHSLISLCKFCTRVAKEPNLLQADSEDWKDARADLFSLGSQVILSVLLCFGLKLNKMFQRFSFVQHTYYSSQINQGYWSHMYIYHLNHQWTDFDSFIVCVGHPQTDLYQLSQSA